ncbi:DUF2079 domain-containing protein [Actinomadura barringtoniae]|uniref:DUF2079 domain-containing protein n=1 Tax=Actinomadura barringtoniae TaxID=1427535 RepID=A0A939T973_9ACTN|nr:DUF2079 domain-containing protein [Actinomadura barringtoniae]MBO2454883.1 DUF2079 domain-containing protein [Actinomadura barringtoniae]
MAEAVAVDERADEEPAGRPRWVRRPPAPALLVAAAAALYSTYSLLQLYTFKASTYDLVIFDQAIRSYSRFEMPRAMVKSVHNGFGSDFSILGDHFSPILALLAPFYWIHDGPATLLIAQALLLALAIVPIWRYTRRHLGRGAAYGVSIGYTLSWPIAEALDFDFHEVAFVPLLTALMVERYDAGKRRQAAIVAAALLLVKEDMGLLLVGFGLYLLTRRGERRWGAGYIVVGMVATWLCSKVLITAFGGDDDYYWAYGSLGSDMSSAARHALTHPWDVVTGLLTPSIKVGTMALLVAPLLLLPLASPLTLTVLPLVAERMLADRANWWEPRYHYNAFLIAVLLMAAVDGSVRLRRVLAPQLAKARARLPERVRTHLHPGMLTGAGIAAAALITVPYFSFNALADPNLWRRNDRARAAAAAAALVPDDALVEAVNPIGPVLSTRARVLLWDRRPRNAPWVVADTRRIQFPFWAVEEQRLRVTQLQASGYRTLFARDGYLVLHRPD